jgi:hypothetical protein
MRKLLSILIALAPFATGAERPPEYHYQILYTGRTLGYARVPDQQTIPASHLDVPNTIAKEFLEQFRIATRTDITQIRLAMGDNFSPDLFGRSLLVTGKPVKACDGSGAYAPYIHLPKDYFNYDDAKGFWTVWCDPDTSLAPGPFRDNVADFLIKAGYDAVVPGKHDFYFGPGYLRQIGKFLADADKPVRMLGENLIVASTLAAGPMNAHPRIPERLAEPCHYDTGRGHDCYHTDFGPASLDLPDNVLPWKQQFLLHGARRAKKKGTTELFRSDELKFFKDAAVDYTDLFNPELVEIVIEPLPPVGITAGDPSKTPQPTSTRHKLIAADQACADGGVALGHLRATCQALYPESDGKYDREKRKASTDKTFLFQAPDGHLEPGRNHMFCVKPAEKIDIFGSDTAICKPFAVQVPMFWPIDPNGQPQRSAAMCKGNSNYSCPYAWAGNDKLKLAVFGVVDPDLLSNVGMLNTVWWNHNTAWDTAVQVTAADYALLQTLELCNASDECRKAPKVLMAQMSYARATQLLANSSFSGVFDAVVTQASAEHDTGNVTKTYQGAAPRFALTPPVPTSTDQVQGSWTRDAGLPDGKAMSQQVFTPQVYVATIGRTNAPVARTLDDAAKSKPAEVAKYGSEITEADKRNCRIVPPDAPAREVTSLPGDPGPHDFGSCWKMKNISAHWIEPPKEGVQYREDLVKYEGEPPKPFCGRAKDGCMNLDRMAQQYLAKYGSYGSAQAKPPTAPAASDAFSQAVLVAMRRAVKTDIAMLQTRDLYDADNQSLEALTGKQVQDQISRIVWKGDELIVLHVTGGTIRKLLKQSAAFAQLDKNSLNTEVENGRDLVTLGIYGDPKDSDTYYINGAVMSDAALYSVAATDFISGGDTGYANLVPPDVLPAFRVGDFAQKRVHPIAGLVCKAITTLGGNLPAQTAAREQYKNWPEENVCADMQLDHRYFDESRQAPTDSTAGYSTLKHWAAFTRNFRAPRRPLPNTEDQVQQRPFWSLKLENLDFSQTGVMIGNLKNTAPNLAGISNPLLSSKGSQSIGADHKARAVFDYRRGTFYLLSDSSFSYQSQRAYTVSSQTLATAVSLSNNTLGSEMGGTFRFQLPKKDSSLKKETARRRERPAWLSVQYSVRYERELIDPFDTQFTIKASPPSSTGSGTGDPSLMLATNATLHPPQISTIYGRTGLRAENNDTYLEAGLEQIDSRGLVQAYTIPNNGSTIYCQPSVSAMFQCGPELKRNSAADNIPLGMLPVLGPSSSITPGMITTSYRTPGAYLNFFWKFPIFSRRDANRADQSFYFTLTNKGDIFFRSSDDTAVQTRYLEKLTPALSLPIWAGLSFTPKVDIVLYQNKVGGAHYRAIQPNFSLSYTFNWRQGMDWRRALKYGAQTTTPSPAGSTH